MGTIKHTSLFPFQTEPHASHGPYGFALLHIVGLPSLLALAAWAAHASGLDYRVEAWFFDAASGGFPAHAWDNFELIGHHFAKTAVVVAWVALLSIAVFARFCDDMVAHRDALAAGAIAMGLGPLLVGLLKGMNSYRCPWSLTEFGGYADSAGRWFVTATEAGNCFPGGHASSGFSLLALYFLARQCGRPALARRLMALALAVGGTFSLIRMWQGAHFLSHNLWSGAICWGVAGLVFLPLQFDRSDNGVGGFPGASI